MERLEHQNALSYRRKNMLFNICFYLIIFLMIDTHIPPPNTIPRNATPRHRGEPPLPRHVLAAMNVNDSVLIVGDARAVQNARTAASIYGRKNNQQFTTRAEGEGVRIWRTL